MSKRIEHYDNLLQLANQLYNTYNVKNVRLNEFECTKKTYTIEVELTDNFILNKQKVDLIFNAVENNDYMIRQNVWDKIELIFFYDNK
jgi:hypothetical protein